MRWEIQQAQFRSSYAGGIYMNSFQLMEKTPISIGHLPQHTIISFTLLYSAPLTSDKNFGEEPCFVGKRSLK